MSHEVRIRRIAHVDMDAFYASCELLRYPQLKDLPVVIGGSRRRESQIVARLQAFDPQGDWTEQTLAQRLHEIPVAAFPLLKEYTGRGVITTSTYAARQWGVGSAMGLMKAARLCPQAILLPMDFELYREYSRRFKKIITDIAPCMEDRGIDEVYLDLTDVPGGQREGGRALAKLIQREVEQATGLTCSIGVAPNKLMAKMASEFEKPKGISVVMDADLQTRIWPLTCRKINGIGPKAEQKLAGFGIHTVGDLAHQDRQWLMGQFGKTYGAWLHDAAWGRDDKPVQNRSTPVSMSRETTFDTDLHAVRDRQALGAIFTRLCEQVAADLANKGLVGRTVGIKLRWDNFKSTTRDVTLEHAVWRASDIRHHAGQCLKRVNLDQHMRLLGVRVGSLMPLTQWQTQELSEPDPQSPSPLQTDLF